MSETQYDSLRDWINYHVSSGCGGAGGQITPTSIQQQLNDLNQRVSHIEAGIGFTATFNDDVCVAAGGDTTAFYAIVPADGVLQRIQTLVDQVSASYGVASMTLSIIRNSSQVASYTLSRSPSSMIDSQVLGYSVRTGDLLTLSWANIAIPTEGTAPTIIQAQYLVTTSKTSQVG